VGALTANFKDRIEFAFIQDQGSGSKAFKEFYDIAEAPTVLLVTPNDDRLLYGGNMKVPELTQWLEPYALDEKIEHDLKTASDDYIKTEWTNSHSQIVKSYAEFEKKILENDRAALVYLTSE
jgi:hypothetical protein